MTRREQLSKEKRNYPNRPIVGVGVVVWKDGNVLLIRRGTPPIQNEWSLPGGAQDLGESLKQTAHREVLEETGLTISSPLFVDVVDAIIPDADGNIQYHYTLVDFTAHWLSGELRAADDAIDARWTNPDRLDEFHLWTETTRIIHLAKQRISGTDHDTL